MQVGQVGGAPCLNNHTSQAYDSPVIPGLLTIRVINYAETVGGAITSDENSEDAVLGAVSDVSEVRILLLNRVSLTVAGVTLSDLSQPRTVRLGWATPWA